jgi:hypothetical protein
MGKIKTCAWLLLASIIGLISPAIADPSLSQSATQYVNQFWIAWSGPSSTALTYIKFAASDPINFYGKSISRDDYMKTQEAFMKRWPMRQYTVVPNSEVVSCNQAALTCDINGSLSWRNFDPVRKVTSTGTAKFGLSLKGVSDQSGKLTGFLIDAVTGSTIDRNLLQAPPAAATVNAASASGNFAPSSSGGDSDDPNIIVSDAALQNAGCASADGEVFLHQGCTSVSELDVTKTFHTPKRTVFEITQAKFDPSAADPTGLSFCFFQRDKAQCQYPDGDFSPNEFSDLSVVYLGARLHAPLLHAVVSWCCGFGCGGAFNYIWAFNSADNQFSLIWNRPFDCHTALRFVEKGPLAGDMIAVDNDVTGRWPWPYGIEVYRFDPPDQLVKILYIVGRAGQGGKYVSGPDDAIDIDMPQILRSVGISK